MLSGNVEKQMNMGCKNDVKMWIEVTERDKSHSIQMLQIYGRKAVLIVPILIGKTFLKASRNMT